MDLLSESHFNTPELKISKICIETYPCRHLVSMYGMPCIELGGNEIYKLLKVNCLLDKSKYFNNHFKIYENMVEKTKIKIYRFCFKFQHTCKHYVSQNDNCCIIDKKDIQKILNEKSNLIDWDAINKDDLCQHFNTES